MEDEKRVLVHRMIKEEEPAEQPEEQPEKQKRECECYQDHMNSVSCREWSIESSPCLFIQQLLSTFYIADTMQGAGDTREREKADSDPTLLEFTV